MTSSANASTSNLPVAAELLLPHRPPMLLVEQLVERQGDRAVASLTVPASAIWLDEGRVLPEAFIELIAQTIAMANGFDCLQEGGQVRDGLLAGIDDFACYGTAMAGEEMLVSTLKDMAFGPVTVVSGQVMVAGRLVAEGVIKVWEAPG